MLKRMVGLHPKGDLGIIILIKVAEGKLREGSTDVLKESDYYRPRYDVCLVKELLDEICRNEIQKQIFFGVLKHLPLTFDRLRPFPPIWHVLSRYLDAPGRWIEPFRPIMNVDIIQDEIVDGACDEELVEIMRVKELADVFCEYTKCNMRVLSMMAGNNSRIAELLVANEKMADAFYAYLRLFDPEKSMPMIWNNKALAAQLMRDLIKKECYAYATELRWNNIIYGLSGLFESIWNEYWQEVGISKIPSVDELRTRIAVEVSNGKMNGSMKTRVKRFLGSGDFTGLPEKIRPMVEVIHKMGI